MRHIIIGMMLLCAIIHMSVDAYTQESSIPYVTDTDRQFIQAINEFTFDIFKEVVNVGEDTNVVLSPFSISYALGMTYSGASGTVADSIRRILHLEMLSEGQIYNAYRRLILLLEGVEHYVNFEIANSIWPRGCTPNKEFADICRTHFYADVKPISAGDIYACDSINNWVAEKTHDRIMEIIACPAKGVMYLINAIYFLADWTFQFDKLQTMPDLFRLDSDSVVLCRMLIQKNVYLYELGSDFQAAALEYGDGKYRMVLISPLEESPLTDLIDTFNLGNWQQLLGSLKRDSVVVSLPKFRMQYELNLKPILMAMGMRCAFIWTDFAKIGCGDLYIGEALHKTYIRVNEEGTEAAAVTSIRLDGLVERPKGIELKFNRPFLFLIYEDFTGTILFIGKIMKPVWEEG